MKKITNWNAYQSGGAVVVRGDCERDVVRVAFVAITSRPGFFGPRVIGTTKAGFEYRLA